MRKRFVHIMLAGLATASLLFAIDSVLTRPEVPIDGTAVEDVRTLLTAEGRYYVKFEKYASREELVDHGLLDPAWRAEPTRDGYHFEVRLLNDRRAFIVAAAPVDRSSWFSKNPQCRFFYADQSGAIRTSVSRPAGPDDPTI